MMKKYLVSLYCLIILQFPLSAQIQSGFSPKEARDMIALSNSFTFLDLYDDDSDIIPVGYKKEFTSGVFGMDNKYQVYVKGKTGVICFRGSTADQKSWLANIESAMIPAQGKIIIQNDVFEYKLAEDTAAAVHSGYVLGLAFLHQSILMQVKYLNAMGIYDIYLTGHSQGGALAALLLAYLEGLPSDRIASHNRFKTYAFANPMIGNKAFAKEYNQRFASTYLSFSIINPADPVPRLPVNYMEEKLFSKEGISSLLGDEEGFSTERLLKSAFFQTFEQTATSYIQSISASANDRLIKDLGKVILPAYVNDINYAVTGNRIQLRPFDYPKLLKDWAVVNYDSLANVVAKDENGYFLDNSLYKKPPMFFQHKPHNYYVGVLKAYFPTEYDALPEKCLPENL
ncbi:hypothetical protein N6H18_15035 [Reichenbachiella agarivorans]|uniref:Fungal lipase-type domain-containing protein n=1 Tax=Reichenbachiella agarivorans TaxID=2979464 RepID=A0ABY6CMF4_9BACT|nr:hypothetical protein [Reichenbachiella agarivorans]UXP31662.1 hypothetical protein N6H18_15035 [Reichenbachiella agarivorans]